MKFLYLMKLLLASLTTGSLSTMSVWLLRVSSGYSSSSSIKSSVKALLILCYRSSAIKIMTAAHMCNSIWVKDVELYQWPPPLRCPPGRSSWETLRRLRSGWAAPGRSPSLTPCRPPSPLCYPPEAGSWCHVSLEYASGIKQKEPCYLINDTHRYQDKPSVKHGRNFYSMSTALIQCVCAQSHRNSSSSYHKA